MCCSVIYTLHSDFFTDSKTSERYIYLKVKNSMKNRSGKVMHVLKEELIKRLLLPAVGWRTWLGLF